MDITIALILTLFAGILSGSFTIPMKYIKNLSENKIWYIFGLWCFLIIPFFTYLAIQPNFLALLLKTNPLYFWIPFVLGASWGIGMVFFSLALKHIGIGVSFAINVGIGAAGGALIPLIFFHHNKIFTKFGLFVSLGVFLFIIGVIFAAKAAKQREKTKLSKENNDKNILLGTIFAIITGIGSSFEGVGFAYGGTAYTNSHILTFQTIFFKSNIVWFPIFLGAGIPYVIYFFVVSKNKKTTLVNIKLKDHALMFSMGAMFFYCVILLGIAVSFLGNLGSVILWPVIMVIIILTSTFWGFKFGEWKNTNKIALLLMKISLIFLIIAVFLQILSSMFK